MKFLFAPAFALLSLAALSSAALAEDALPIAKVESLNCDATNGVKLLSVEGTPYVESSWMGFKQTFQLMDQPILTGKNYLRIPLGTKGVPAAYAYDIFLWGNPEAGVEAKLTGVIGQPVYGLYVPPFVASPKTLPVGFRPIAAISCTLLGE